MASGCYIGQLRSREISEPWEVVSTCHGRGMIRIRGCRHRRTFRRRQVGLGPGMGGWGRWHIAATPEVNSAVLVKYMWGDGGSEVLEEFKLWDGTYHPSHRSILKGEKPARRTMGPNMWFASEHGFTFCSHTDVYWTSAMCQGLWLQWWTRCPFFMEMPLCWVGEVDGKQAGNK